jgi:NADPH:quinone reductase-like Zn-dependent oxidoreductase
MKAVVQTGYGAPDVFELRDLPRPKVKENEILVRVRATTINAGDVFGMRGSPWMVRFSVGLPKPKDYIPGWDVAGQVEAVGSAVTRFQPGDEVYASIAGTCAEFACAPEDKFAPKPASLTFEQAAAVPAAATPPLHGLRDHAKVQPGQKVLINGASGGVGTFSVQIAKALGAEVTGVCSTSKVELVRSIGADHVIDYTKEDFVQGGQRYDVVLDNVASRSFSDLQRVVADEGLILPNSGHAGIGYVIGASLRSIFVRQQGGPFLAQPDHDDLVYLTELIEAGKITPVIDRTYPLSEFHEAMTYMDEGHARGKVVLVVERDDQV